MKKLFYCLIITILPALLSFSASGQVILSVAGGGFEGYYGDTSLAIDCLVHWPEAIAIDDSNNKYIADANNNVIRRIDAHTGVITTVVGTGYQYGTGLGGFSGDGGPASAARLYYPSGIALDHSGNMYIADQRNHRIRKVDAAGIISTIAGNGTPGYAGNGSAALTAILNFPTRVSLDASGNLYIADSGNARIRKIDVGGVITTVAGTGGSGYAGDGGPAIGAKLFEPIDMAVDPSGNVYISDYVNNRIRKVDAGGVITTYAGIGIAGFSGDGGPATAANIYEPSGIVLDAAGNLYFSDLANFRVRKISAGGIITTVAGNGSPGYNGDGIPATSAKLWFPEGLALDARGQLFVADKGNNRIRLISSVLGASAVENDRVGISVYPNPNNGSFNVRIRSTVDEDVHIVITSVTGEKLYDTHTTTNKAVVVNTGNFAPGIYFLSASTGHATVNEKVIVR